MILILGREMNSFSFSTKYLESMSIAWEQPAVAFGLGNITEQDLEEAILVG